MKNFGCRKKKLLVPPAVNFYLYELRLYKQETRTDLIIFISTYIVHINFLLLGRGKKLICATLADISVSNDGLSKTDSKTEKR